VIVDSELIAGGGIRARSFWNGPARISRLEDGQKKSGTASPRAL